MPPSFWASIIDCNSLRNHQNLLVGSSSVSFFSSSSFSHISLNLYRLLIYCIIRPFFLHRSFQLPLFLWASYCWLWSSESTPSPPLILSFLVLVSFSLASERISFSHISAIFFAPGWVGKASSEVWLQIFLLLRPIKELSEHSSFFYEYRVICDYWLARFATLPLGCFEPVLRMKEEVWLLTPEPTLLLKLGMNTPLLYLKLGALSLLSNSFSSLASYKSSSLPFAPRNILWASVA